MSSRRAFLLLAALSASVVVVWTVAERMNGGGTEPPPRGPGKAGPASAVPSESASGVGAGAQSGAASGVASGTGAASGSGSESAAGAAAGAASGSASGSGAGAESGAASQSQSTSGRARSCRSAADCAAHSSPGPCLLVECIRGSCDIRPAPDGGRCDDRNPCTAEDLCRGGVCDGVPKDCDDGVACTTDWCDPATGECRHTGDCCTAISDCDDKDPCTVDICDRETNKCLYDSVWCDDGNPCTEDWCEPFEGCRTAPLPNCPRSCQTASDCDDGNLCTDDFCDLPGRVCVPVKVDCNDYDLCTQDYCEPKKGCQFRRIPGCDHCDGDVDCPVPPDNLCIRAQCDLDDRKCRYSQVECDDADECTSDYCVPETGDCWHEPICCASDADCDPKNACSVGKCVAGKCRLSPLPCDDRNPCTLDSCDTDVGCVHEKKANCRPGGR